MGNSGRVPPCVFTGGLGWCPHGLPLHIDSSMQRGGVDRAGLLTSSVEGGSPEQWSLWWSNGLQGDTLVLHFMVPSLP